MTISEVARRIVANVLLGDAGTANSYDGKLAFSRFEAILLCTCAGSLLEHKFFFLALRFKRLLRWGTLLWLPSVFILDILVFAIVYLFLTAQSRWHFRTNAAGFTSRVFATTLVAFIVFACCISMVLLVETGMVSFGVALIIGHELKWKLAFEVEWSSTQSLFTPQIPLFSFILLMQPIFGVLSALILRYWLLMKKNESSSHWGYLPFFTTTLGSRIGSGYERIGGKRTLPVIRWLNHWKYIIISSMYILLLILLRPRRPWNQLSSNPISSLAWTIFHTPRKGHDRINNPPPTWGQNFVNLVAEQFSAAAVDLSKPPRAYLKHPIRNVVIINLESVRADALPLSKKLLEATNSRLVNENLTSEDITPFWTSLMPQSIIMEDTSAISSYTLKTLLSTFCGMYPLNVNFMEEGRRDRYFYQECMPQLLRKTFPEHDHHNSLDRRWWKPRWLTKRGLLGPSSRFQSAFFQTSENTFDHQKEEFDKMGWDQTFYAPDVREFTPDAKKLGWFGVGDNDLLPLLFDWIDKSLGAKKQLLAGILTTSTHFPFPLPEGEKYEKYIDNELVNKYLNSIRKTDEFLRDLMRGFMKRGIVDETMFVMLGDHGHGFDDWEHKSLGALDNPMENAFRVPFMVYSPALIPAGPVEGKFTNLDVLPTVMDALISSSQHPKWDDEYPTHRAHGHHGNPGAHTGTVKNSEIMVDEPVNLTTSELPELTSHEMDPERRAIGNLLDISHDMKWMQVQEILQQYEGTSIFRRPIDPNHPQRMTFHLDNPGNAHVILVQYPMKLVYDSIGEQTYLYDLSHDPGEWEDLLSIPASRGHAPPPAWVAWDEEDIYREFNFRWWRAGTDEFGAGRTAPDRDGSIEYVKPNNDTTGDIKELARRLVLKDAFNWAEDAFEILLGWSWTNRERYLTGRKNVDIVRSTALESLRNDGKLGP